jgi:hypothetical protein
MDRFRQRIPSRAQLAAVLAVIVLILYTWTILWFFWKLPSWLYYLNAGEILNVLSYSLAVNLVESLVVLAVPVLLAVLLPKKWFSDVFVARGAALAMAGLGVLIYVAYHFPMKDVFPVSLLTPLFIAPALALIVLLVFLAGRVLLLRRGIEFLADRGTIFLYILIPLSLVSAFTILIREII